MTQTDAVIKSTPMIQTEAVKQYLTELHDPSGDSVLSAMYEHAERDDIPVVPVTTGALLHLITKATGAKRAVEVGTAIGVSTLNIARGGADVTSFEIDPERHEAATKYMAEAGLTDQTDLRLQDATEGLTQLEGQFDLAFLDGPKTLYGGQVDSVIPLLRPGGILLIDNTLMSGSVALGVPQRRWTAEQVEHVRALNERLVNDKNLIGTVAPIGDGVTIAVRAPR